MATTPGTASLMCEQCRVDMQACMPVHRVWPGRKCDRCLRLRMPCGPNIDPGIRSAGSQTGLNSRPHEPVAVLRCLQTLTDISWDDTGYPNFDVPEGHPCDLPRGFQAIVVGYLSGYTQSNLVLYRLWERTNYINAYEKFDHIYQSLLPGRTAVKAKQLATAKYTAEVLNAQVDPGPYGRPWEEITEAARHILRRASRWMALINGLQSPEILLIDQNNIFLGKVIEGGTDEEFERVKEFLLLPEYNVKDCCLRLTGVTQMISNLADTPKDTEVRRYLTREIQTRIKEVFGPPVVVSNVPPAELQIVEVGGVQRNIAHLFGIRIGVTDNSDEENHTALTSELAGPSC